MKLLDLPPEMIIGIAHNLDLHSLNVFVKTTWCLNTLLTLVLNERILPIRDEVLLWASEHNSLPAAKLALSHGAHVSCCNKSQRTPLHLAALHKNHQIASLLMCAGAEIENLNWSERTPLHYASYSGCVEIIRLLLDAGAGMEMKDCDNFKPLQTAARYGRVEVVRILIEGNAHVNEGYNINQTPLHWAAASGSLESAKLLLDAGALVNSGDYKPFTGFLCYKTDGSGMGKGALDSVVEYGGRSQRVPIYLDDSDTELEKISSGEFILAIDEPYDRDCEVTIYLENIQQGSQTIIFSQEIDCSKVPGDSGILRYKSSGTPLHWAVIMGDLKMVKLLLSYGADVSAWDSNMRSPVSMATMYGRSREIRLVLKAYKLPW